MEREQIVKRIEELHQLICEELDKKKMNKRKFRELCKEQNALRAELDVLDNKVYNDPEWITSKCYTSTISLADARLQLSRMLSGLQGVTVKETSGVQIVTVETKWKTYTFSIHAHHEIEQLEFGYEENPFSKEMYKVCTKQRQVYTAYVEKQEICGSYWAWKY